MRKSTYGLRAGSVCVLDDTDLTYRCKIDYISDDLDEDDERIAHVHWLDRWPGNSPEGDVSIATLIHV